MTQTSADRVPPLAAFLRPELPPGALYGLPGEVAVALGESSGADPAAVLLSFLALLGNAAGPQPHARFGGAEHPARLFVVLVGDAAAGRKGTAVSAVERLFAEADPDWADGRVLFGLQSAEAMIDMVDDDLSGDCRLMVVETEFARLAETMARTGTLSAQLRNAWDGRGLQRTTTRFTRRASRAHISLLGMITPEELLRHHGRLSQAGGLESRILYCYTAPLREVSPFAPAADISGLAAQVRRVLKASRDAVMGGADPVSRHLLTLRGIQPRTELPVGGEVSASWAGVRSRLPVAGDGLQGLHSRAESQVIRLAAAYALADSAPRVTVAHVEAALAVQSYCAQSAEVVFGVPLANLPPRVDPRCSARVVRHLHDRYPDWVPRAEITAALRGTAADVAVTASLASLAARRIAERRAPDEYRLMPPQLTLFNP